MKAEDLITLREGETAYLMRCSNRDRIVPLAFGPGWVALKWREAKWALPIIAKMRGLEIPPEGTPVQ
jgi:hypothetical protein